MIRAYVVTISQAVLGTAGGCLVAGMAAYALSRSNFRFRKPVTIIIFFTMLFSAGMIPTYIVYAKYYGISNSFWVYILPGITGGAWYTMVFRTFFKSLPESLFESAHLDGAGEMTIFVKIVLPLSKAALASIGLMFAVSYWNDYTNYKLYITKANLYNFQMKLRAMMMGSNLPTAVGSATENTVQNAAVIVAILPFMILYPFLQKYFVKGINIGAVKE